MATNSQRLLFFVIMIALITSISQELLYNIDSYDTTVINEYINLGESARDNFRDTGIAPSPEAFQQEIGIGNIIKMGSAILTGFLKGLLPFPFGITQAGNPLELIFVFGLIIFKVYMYYLVGIVLYDKFKNKKTD